LEKWKRVVIDLMGYIAWMDQTLFHLANVVWTTPIFDRLMPALSWMGNVGVIWVVVLGTIAGLGKKTGRKIAVAGLAALAIGFASSEVIKEITMRPRPFLALSDVRLLIPEPSSFAFPSGHTTSAFAATSGAVLAAKRLLRRVPLWGWGMLVLAAAISYSRIYVGVHWPTDVAAGVLLGFASGWAGARLTLRWSKRIPPSAPKKQTKGAESAPEEEQEVEYIS